MPVWNCLSACRFHILLLSHHIPYLMQIIQGLIKKILTQRIKIAIKLIIGFSLLSYLFIKLDIELTTELLLKINPWIFLLSFALALSRNIFGSFRWKILLNSKNYNPSILSLTKYYFIGIYFNFFLPTVVGGDIARGYCLHSHGVRKKDIISSIIIERVMGIVVLVFLSLFSLFSLSLSFNLINNQTKIMVITLGIFSIILLFFYKKADVFLRKILPCVIISKLHWVNNLIQNTKDYGKTPDVLIYCFLFTILFQIFGVFSTYLISSSLGYSIKFIYFLMLLPIVWIISMIPISINGLGVREGAFILLFTKIGMTKEMAMAISILVLLQAVAQGVIGGILFILRRII